MLFTAASASRAPTTQIVQSRFSSGTKGLRSCFSGMVDRMKSKLDFSLPIASASLSSTPVVPRRAASASFSYVVVNSVTSAPIARAILAAMSPRPPKPMMPTLSPGFTPQCFSGE